MKFKIRKQFIYFIPILTLAGIIGICILFATSWKNWQVEHYYQHMETSALEHTKIIELTLDVPFALMEQLALEECYTIDGFDEIEIAKGTKVLAQNSDLDEVFFVNMEGERLQTNGQWGDFILVDNARLLSKTTCFIQQITLDNTKYDGQMLLSIPVYDKGVQLGVLVGTYDLDEFSNMFNGGKNTISEYSTFCVINASGELVIRDSLDLELNITDDFFAVPSEMSGESRQILSERSTALLLGETLAFEYIYEEQLYYLHVEAIAIDHLDTKSFYLAEVTSDEMIQLNMQTYISFVLIVIGIFFIVIGGTIYILMKLQRIKLEFDIISSSLSGGIRRCTLGTVPTMDYASEGLAKMCGYTIKEFKRKVGNNYKTVIVDEDRQKFIDTLAYLRKHRAQRKIEYRIRHQMGHYVWVEDCITSARSTNGKLYAYAVINNINDLKESKTHLDTLMNSIPGGITIFDINTNTGQVTIPFFNDVVCKMTGFTKEEFTKITETAAWNVVVEEDIPLVRSKFEQVIYGAEYVECVYRTKTITGSKWMHITGNVIKRIGEHIRVYAVILDVDEKYQVELELEQQRYYQNTIDESIEAATLVISLNENRDLLYLSKNLSALLGYTEEEFKKIYANKYKDLIHPEEYKRIINLKHTYEENQQPIYELEFRVRHKNGHYIWLAEKAKIVDAATGDKAYLIVAFDISARKEMEELTAIREEEFRIAVIQNDKLVYRYDLESRSIRPSQGLEDVLGFEAYQNNTEGGSIERVMKNPDNAAQFETLFNMIHSGQPSGREVLRLEVEGETVQWYEVRYTLVYDTKKLPTSAIVTVTNRTTEYEGK